MASWLCSKIFTANNASVVWKEFMHTLSWIGCGLAWKVGNGEDIQVGIDPIMGTENLVVLPQVLHENLEDYDIVFSGLGS